MDKFYFTELRVFGQDVNDSVVTFKPGVNIIYGASNTGKSLVIECLNYALGSDDVPSEVGINGFSSVRIKMENTQGDFISITREIKDVPDKPKRCNTATVISSIPDIESGDWKIKSNSPEEPSLNNTLFLKLLGIEPPVEVIAKQNREKNRLSFRTFIHQFLLDEDSIHTKIPIIDNRNHRNIELSLNSLSFLINGLSQTGDKFDTELEAKAKKSAVIRYISNVLRTYEDRQIELTALLEEIEDCNPQEELDLIIRESEEMDSLLSEAIHEEQNIYASISSKSGELEESLLLLERRQSLKSMYEADLERLAFIVKGEMTISDSYVDTCPFCENPIHDKRIKESYIEVARIDLQKTEAKLKELDHSERELVAKIDSLDVQIEDLEKRREQLNSRIATEYKPRALELKKRLSTYRRIIELEKEQSLKEEEIFALKKDIEEKDNEKIKIDKYKAKDEFDTEAFKKLSTAVGNAIKLCGYPDVDTAELSKKTFDIVVNNKDKKQEGKGYRAFLNTIYGFTLMKFLEREAVYPPKLFIADSPGLSLVENEDVLIDDSMKTGLYRYILDHCGNCQVIIVDNNLPDGVDFRSANLIHFTKSNQGRYGFLNGVFNGQIYHKLDDVSDSNETNEEAEETNDVSVD